MLYTPSHAELAQHPKTRRLSRWLGVSIPTTIGHLHLLWHFALKYCPDGDLRDYSVDDIEEGCMWEGEPGRLWNGLAAGWLDYDEDADTWRVHDWEEYGGKLVNRKEANAARMREARAKQPSSTEKPRATHVQRTSAARVEPEESRGEKKRVEESRPPSSPPAPQRPDPSPPDGGVRAVPKPKILDAMQQVHFDEWYRRYPNKQHRPDAERAWRKLSPDRALYERLILDLDARRAGRKWAEGYIEHPATYLNQHIWEDDIEPIRAVPARASPNGERESTAQARERRTLEAIWGKQHGPADLQPEPIEARYRVIGRADPGAD